MKKLVKGKQKIMKCPKYPSFSNKKNPNTKSHVPCPRNAKSSSPETDNKEQLPGLWVLTSSCTHPFIIRTRLQDLAPSPPTAVVAGWLSKGIRDSAGQCCTLFHLPLPPAALLPDSVGTEAGRTPKLCHSMDLALALCWHCRACTQAKQKVPAQ